MVLAAPPPIAAAADPWRDLLGSWDDIDDPDVGGRSTAPTGSLSSLGMAALAYAALGWPVLPCVPRGKEPLVAGGYRAATLERDQIVAWWARTPDANIGYRPDGRVVLDADSPDALSNAVKQGFYLPPTAIVETARGSHYHYRTDRPVRTRAAFLPGLDLKGTGGYVLLPPSIHTSGQRYRWRLSPDLIAPCPAWVLELRSGRRRFADVGPGERIPDGARNDYLAAVFGAVRRFGVTATELVELGRAINARCQPRLFDRDIRRIADSIASYPPSRSAREVAGRGSAGAPVSRARTGARRGSDRGSRPQLEVRPPGRWSTAEFAARMATAPDYRVGPLADEEVEELARRYQASTGQPISSRDQWELLAGGARVHGDDFLPFVADLFAATGSANNLLGIIRTTLPRTTSSESPS